MSFIKEFKEFAMKGNVMDLAVGVIIGGAFGKIVTSLVDNILMPIIGLFTRGKNFNDVFYVLDTSKGDVATLADAKAKGIAVFAYGAFIQSVIDFLIIAFCIFLLVKFMNKLSKKKRRSPGPG
ncbi:large conductance mechanosensitive channel [Chitinophaga sp. W2I13]|uniref:large conductance mechanosensitive channel protein MscL n=1 Tax=Chitinophaga sp. W2I13 TaxID=3373923 RepID=UPI003D2635B1